MQTAIPLSSQRRWLAWLGTVSFVAYAFFIQIAPGIMGDELRQAFAIDAKQFGWGMGIFLYAFGPMQPIVGLLFDHWWSRWLLVGACGVIVVGFILPVLFPVFSLLVIGRALTGLGASFSFIGALSLVNLLFPSNRAGLLTGMTSGLSMLATIAGIPLLALAIQELDWVNIFLAFGLCGCIVQLFIIISVPAKLPQERLESTTATPLRVRALLAKLCSELHQVLTCRQVWLLCITTVSLALPMTSFAGLWAVSYLTTTQQIPTETAAHAVAIFYIGWFFGGTFLGWWGDHVGQRKRVLIITTLANIGLTSWLVLPSEISIELCFIMIFIMGFIASASLNGFPASAEFCPQLPRALAMAVINMVVLVVSAFFHWLIGALLHWQVTSDTLGDPDTAAVYSASAFRLAMWVFPVMAAAGLVACCRLRRTTCLLATKR